MIGSQLDLGIDLYRARETEIGIGFEALEQFIKGGLDLKLRDGTDGLRLERITNSGVHQLIHRRCGDPLGSHLPQHQLSGSLAFAKALHLDVLHQITEGFFVGLLDLISLDHNGETNTATGTFLLSDLHGQRDPYLSMTGSVRIFRITSLPQSHGVKGTSWRTLGSLSL